MSKVGAHVILHGQPVRVGVVANGTVIFPHFMRVSVVDQTSGVAIRTAALVAGERPLVSTLLLALYVLLLSLRQPSAGPGGGGRLAGHWRRGPRSFFRAAPIHLHQGLDLAVEFLYLGLVLFVPFQVIQQLLLDFEGFPTLLASMSVGRGGYG